MKKLVAFALKARKMAYAPYSKFKVGAAILSKDGRIFAGCNVENASNSLGICAERAAVCKAVSEGAREFSAIAVATEGNKFSTPCGACRQTLEEFSPKMDVLLVNSKGKTRKIRFSRLFPRPFKLR